MTEIRGPAADHGLPSRRGAAATACKPSEYDDPVSPLKCPSPILEAFVRAVAEKLPADQREKLKGYEASIATTTDAEDRHRARHCALWAIHLASDKELPHPGWRRIKELHEVWKDLWFGIDYGLVQEGTGKREPLEDAEIEWVEDAVNVAQHVGSSLGWEHAPWDQLLQELIAMEPQSNADL